MKKITGILTLGILLFSVGQSSAENLDLLGSDECFDSAKEEFETYLDNGGNPERAVEWFNAAYAGCYCQNNPC